MFGIYAYFVIMLIFGGIPLLFLWLTSFKLLLKHKRIFAYTLTIFFIVGWVWDYLSIKEGVWGFSNIVGLWFLGLPIEEWVFILIAGLVVSSLTLVMIERGGK